MPVEKTLEAYRIKRLNCAQSILKGFQEHHRVSDQHVEDFRHFGGGKAENGMCGALFAARQLAGDDHAAKAALDKAFLDSAGSLSCREIRKIGRLSCLQCVELAAKTLAESGIDKREIDIQP
jgi:hypothetical protein